MDLDQLKKILDSGSNGLRVWVFEFPTETSPIFEDASAESHPQATRRDAGQVAELQQALALGSVKSGTRLSPREWAERIPSLVERELIRAIRHGAVTCEARGEGKGHAAKVISVEELVRYLAACEAVQGGREPVPVWWSEVRKGVRAVIREEVAHAA